MQVKLGAMLLFSDILYLLLQLILVSGQQSTGSSEYCLAEQFEADCGSDNQVLFMTAARYGRMRIGRCVRTDFGFVGCSSDVLHIVDGRCSGRRRCGFTVPDPLFEKTEGCNAEFKSYLEATYQCLHVAVVKASDCQAAKHMRLSEPSGYLANIVTEETGCGSETIPWLVDVGAGKKIKFVLYDFSSDTMSSGPASCRNYAVLRETASSQRFTVCGGRRQRRSDVYISVTNLVEVRVMKQLQSDGDKWYFIIQYQGCSDPEITSNIWLKRSGDTVVIGCTLNQIQWTLQCVDGSWVGGNTNCTQEALQSSSIERLSDSWISLPFEVSIAIIAGLAFIVGVTVFTAGIIFVKRRHLGRYQSDGVPPSEARYRLAATQRLHSLTKCDTSSYQPDFMPDMYPQSAIHESDYAYVWDSPGADMCSAGVHRGHSEAGLLQLQSGCSAVTVLPIRVSCDTYETTTSKRDREPYAQYSELDDAK